MNYKEHLTKNRLLKIEEYDDNGTWLIYKNLVKMIYGGFVVKKEIHIGD